MAKLFGFTVGREEKEKEQENLQSFAKPEQDDGSIQIAPGGAYGTYIDLEGEAKNESELINRYRQMSTQAEVEEAIQDIVNEAIVIDEQEPPVEIVLDDLSYSDQVKEKIREEFNNVVEMLDFNNNAYETFRKWYVDGRLYHHLVINTKQPKKGIQEIRYIDPRKIKKMREYKKDKDPQTGATLYKGYTDYFLYNPGGMKQSAVTGSQNGIKIAADSISYVHSGVMDYKNSTIYSHLHKAIKPFNQLRMLEDAVVIYRLVRAPERRIFNIDVGNLPKAKAEQYIRDMMTKHKNKLVYNAQTGEIKDDRRFMTMLEDYWFPKREGRGTQIDTLPGGENLGQMDDVEYFKKKLYKSLNVPITRMESENQFNLGRASEITRDEVKFSKFVTRLRARFSQLFLTILEIQLSLKGIVSRKEFKEVKKQIRFDYAKDNHFTEMKEAEILSERLRLLNEVDPFVGSYFSREWVQKNVLRMSEEDIKEMEKQIDKDAKKNPDVPVGVDPQQQQPAQQPQPQPEPQPEPDEKKDQEKKNKGEEEKPASESLINDEDRDLVTEFTKALVGREDES